MTTTTLWDAAGIPLVLFGHSARPVAALRGNLDNWDRR
jgi:hypothetical protein